MARLRLDLEHGWQFREDDERSSKESPWLSVQSVPTQVHIDLLVNKKYAEHDIFCHVSPMTVKSPIVYLAVGYQILS